MSSPADAERAIVGFRAALAAGRMAHAWLVVGDPDGGGGDAATLMLQHLFCTGETPPCGTCLGCRSVHERHAADVVWVEPESKSRQITVERFRDEILPRMSQKSFGGGWKAVVVLHADRMNDSMANAFLKTLEEPPPHTIILLLSGAPDRLLPTIVSRCQRITASGLAEDSPWRVRVLDLLAVGTGEGVAGRMVAAAAMSGLFEEFRKMAEDEIPESVRKEEVAARGAKQADAMADARVGSKLGEFKRDLLSAVAEWQRDILALVLGAESAGLRHPGRIDALRRQAAPLDYGAALERVRRADDMARQFDRNMPPESVFWAFWRDLPTGR